MFGWSTSSLLLVPVGWKNFVYLAPDFFGFFCFWIWNFVFSHTSGVEPVGRLDCFDMYECYARCYTQTPLSGQIKSVVDMFFDRLHVLIPGFHRMF